MISAKIKTVGLMALMAAAGPVQADGLGGSVISDVLVEAGSVVVFAPGLLNPDGCGTAGYVIMPPEQVKQDHFLSIALTALTTGATVHLWVAGCLPRHWGASAPILASLRISRTP